jgi:large subunit ribosomal protein L32e
VDEMEQKRLIELRKKMKKRQPGFQRVESWRYKRVKSSWRKARGIDSKTRRKSKSGVKSPSVGYRSPKKVRGIHPSGYEEIRVFTIKDLDNLNKNKHALKISSRLGAKKRIKLIDLAQKRGFKVLNLGISQQELEHFESLLESSLEEEEYVDIDELEED